MPQGFPDFPVYGAEKGWFAMNTMKNKESAEKVIQEETPQRLWERRLSGETLYNGRIIRVEKDRVQLENGQEAFREVVRHPGGVSVAVLTGENQILLVRQFRYPYGKTLLECPAGKLEPGEDPFEAACREQLEETGTTGQTYVFLGEMYPTPGYCDEIIRMYACRQAQAGEQDLDPDEFLEVERVPLEEAERMVLQGEIRDGKTQIMVLKTAGLVRQGKL